MSDADTGSAPAQTIQVPSLLTNSARAVMAAFGPQITQLSAVGSIETTNRTPVDGLREYAVTWEQTTAQRITIEYERLAGADGPSNPLDASAQETLADEIAARLETDALSVPPDLAVRSCTIEVTDERLEAVTPAQTPTFELQFVSDPVETPLRAVTKRRNAERGLYDELGFNCHNLNLHRVTETAVKYHQQSSGVYLRWNGPGDLRPNIPERLAIRINDHVLPDAYGVLKPYVVTDDRTLELAENARDRIETQRSTASGNTTDAESRAGSS